jgi:putative Mn2+ efflux pump MntP
VGKLLLVAAALGLSNFAAAIGMGLTGVDTHMRVRIGLGFGLFEAGMPLVGLLIGRGLADTLGRSAGDLGAALLIAVGVYTIWKSWGSTTDPRPVARGARFLVTAFALSIDNLVIGFALGVYHVPMLEAVAIIAAASVSMSLVGLELGDRAGARIGTWSEEIGGAVLILVGVALGLGVLG